MKNRILAAFLAFGLVSAAIESRAAIVTVAFDSGGQTLTNFDGITPLAGGTSTDGDGTVLQLGYFSAGTSAAPFAGTWIALTGEGGANSGFATTTVGDRNANGAGNGTFALAVEFNTLIPGRDAALPMAGTPIAIRVYNGTSLAVSTHYITISNSAVSWQWVSPTEPTPVGPTLSLDDAGLRLEDGTAMGSAVGVPTPSSFATANPIPEPSAFALQAMVVLCGFFGRTRGRRRK